MRRSNGDSFVTVAASLGQDDTTQLQMSNLDLAGESQRYRLLCMARGKNSGNRKIEY